MSENNDERQVSETNIWPGLQPDIQHTQPIDPPPQAPPISVEDGDEGVGALERERRRTRIFMATTAVAGAALVGTLFYASAQGQSAGTPIAATERGGQAGPGFGMHDGDDDGLGMPGRGMDQEGPEGGMPGGPGSGAPVLQFFNQDGSVNTALVDQYKELGATDEQESFMAQRLAHEIDEALASGLITDAQVKALSAALDIDLSDTDDQSASSSSAGQVT